MTTPTKLISDDEILDLYVKQSLPFLHPWQVKPLQTFVREVEAVILRRQQILREHEDSQSEEFFRQIQDECCDPNL